MFSKAVLTMLGRSGVLTFAAVEISRGLSLEAGVKILYGKVNTAAFMKTVLVSKELALLKLANSIAFIEENYLCLSILNNFRLQLCQRWHKEGDFFNKNAILGSL